MNKEDILVEMNKWEDPTLFENMIDELKQYIVQLDKIMYLRYMKLIDSFSINDDEKQKLYRYFFDKGLIDINGNLINNPSIVVTSDPRIVLSNYTKSGIGFSQNGYKLFYSTYLMFASGNKEGVRNFDYSQPLSNLHGLSEIEILYWCFCHNYTYQEFFKSIMVHENVHKWTVNIDAPGDVIHSFLDECMVELEARKIASLYGLSHIPIFRNREINIFNAFTKDVPEDLINYCLMTCDTNKLIDYFISIHSNNPDQNRQECYQRLADIIDQVAIGKNDLNHQKLNQFNSFYDMFNGQYLIDEMKIITELEDYQTTPCEKKSSSQMST